MRHDNIVDGHDDIHHHHRPHDCRLQCVERRHGRPEYEPGDMHATCATDIACATLAEIRQEGTKDYVEYMYSKTKSTLAVSEALRVLRLS